MRVRSCSPRLAYDGSAGRTEGRRVVRSRVRYLERYFNETMNIKKKKLHTSLPGAMPRALIERYSRQKHLSLGAAEIHARELKKFLAVCASRRVPSVPSEIVDAIWHEFILHTSEYSRFCTTNFGKFIHHVPSREGAAFPHNAYSATIRALRRRFRSVNQRVWPPASTLACRSCTTCADSPLRGPAAA